jgi:hypothetical protein
MEGFSFVTPVTGLNRPNTGKEDDDDAADAAISPKLSSALNTERVCFSETDFSAEMEAVYFSETLFSSEDADSMFLRNVLIYLRIYTALQPRKTTSFSQPREQQMSWSMGHNRNVYNILVRKRDLKSLGVDKSIILKLKLEIY